MKLAFTIILGVLLSISLAGYFFNIELIREHIKLQEKYNKCEREIDLLIK